MAPKEVFSFFIWGALKREGTPLGYFPLSLGHWPQTIPRQQLWQWYEQCLDRNLNFQESGTLLAPPMWREFPWFIFFLNHPAAWHWRQMQLWKCAKKQKWQPHLSKSQDKGEGSLRARKCQETCKEKKLKKVISWTPINTSGVTP